MKTKKFDCVQMKRQGAAKVREQTATLTREQELRFWQERSAVLASTPGSAQSGGAVRTVDGDLSFSAQGQRAVDTVRRCGRRSSFCGSGAWALPNAASS